MSKTHKIKNSGLAAVIRECEQSMMIEKKQKIESVRPAHWYD